MFNFSITLSGVLLCQTFLPTAIPVAPVFIISFTSDWLYPTQENKDIVIALNAISADVGFVEIESDKGHDSFLLDVPDFLSALKNFLDKSYTDN